jgi:lipoprotein-releasing system permease protein
VPWFIYYALKQLFPSKKVISYFSLISIIGVALGVSVLIIVQSVMNGFGENIRRHLAKTNGDILIYSSEGMLQDWGDLFKDLRSDKTIKTVSPYIESILMVQSEAGTAFPYIRGIDVRNTEPDDLVIPIDEFIVAGSYSALNDETVFLGVPLAKKLNVKIGDSVALYSPRLLEYLTEEEWLFPKEFQVAGLVQSGSPKLDENLVLGSLGGTQDLLEAENAITGFVINLWNTDDSSVVSAKALFQDRVLDYEESLLVKNWMDMNADLLFILEQEKMVISFIIIFIILVASFSIAVALTLSVIRKTREIGLLNALGAESWQIALCFCLQGLFIGLVGSILGIIFAFLVLENRDALFGAYLWIMNSNDVQFLGVYDLYSIPVKYLWKDFSQVLILSSVISFSAALVPALKAAKLKPSEALRYE